MLYARAHFKVGVSPASGSPNGLYPLAAKHVRGVLSAARTSDPNSAGSQFFLMHADSPHLDNQYSVFGKVTSGLEVVDKIANAPRGANDRPKNPTTIRKITVRDA